MKVLPFLNTLLLAAILTSLVLILTQLRQQMEVYGGPIRVIGPWEGSEAPPVRVQIESEPVRVEIQR